MHDVLSLSIQIILLFSPSLAYAHGNDDVTVASFIGPTVAIIVFVTVVGLGRALLRMIIKEAKEP